MNWMEPVAEGGTRWAIAALVLFAAYALGCFSPGYYLVRWKTGQDIRQTGSGGSGATNVGRILGRNGFILTLVIDLLKGVLAVTLAEGFGGGFVPGWLVVAFVVAGHVWPILLGFRGGKGIATLIGAVVVEDIKKALLIVALFVVIFAFLRRFSISGLLALALLPFALVLAHYQAGQVAGYVAISLLILWTHRQNLRAEFHRIRPEMAVKPPEEGPAQKA